MRFWAWTLFFATTVTTVSHSGADAAPPELKYLYPAGLQRGTTVTVEATGSIKPWPPQIWTDRSGLKIEPAEEKNQLKITADSTAEPGVYLMRLYNEEGASALRPLIVGALPEVNEKESNNDFREPQLLESTEVVVNGRLNGGNDVDTFAVNLAAGQTIVASMTANEVLASPMDAILEITSPDGYRLAYNHDTYNLDPQLVFTAPADGTYLIRTFAFPAQPNQSISFSASASYIYRLTLTTGPFLDHAFPLAASTQGPVEVELRGWNIPQTVKFLTAFPANAEDDFVVLSHPELANTGRMKAEPHAVTVESTTNQKAHPQPITLPITISGAISEPREEDWYKFTATKGQKLEFRAESWSLGFPLDPLIRVTDVAGKRLAQADDINRNERDAVVSYTIPADGEYRLMIRDVHRHGGFRYVYRLSATIPQPDYQLTLADDQFTLTPGKELEIPVTVARQHGFNGEISVTVVDLPEGVNVTPVVSPAKGDASKKVTLKLTATAGPASQLIRVIGSVKEKPELERTAAATITGLTSTIRTPWLTVLKPAEKK